MAAGKCMSARTADRQGLKDETGSSELPSLQLPLNAESMASHRTILTTAVAFLTFVALFLVYDDFSVISRKMTTTSSIPIEVTLSSEVSEASILGSAQLRITLANTSPHEVFLLRWSSPLDVSLPSIGVVSFTSTNSGVKAPCLDMKINHRVPPEGYFSINDQSIVHIPANGKVDTVVEFKEPKVALVKGDEYRAKAVGSWMGVWVNESGREVERLEMDRGMRTGDFQSNEILIRVSSDESAELRE
ncbi:hypothetical protein ONS95_001932 [Cadophora gregata]|uniref:uncharacterized protein n=1 Tax=Cadophora gregata TaxID=51156 RepID=UPI0026DC8CBE|nr:uncharacterized protein ONS95_001932 [Cadophora gregata]KAK0111584.1 hypothetical protein ONS95_001932 [Cadophora gregata]KAK0111941.1 hypothetical protein ONS96_001205 [Cadophora gregata f. sp. sojae]